MKVNRSAILCLKLTISVVLIVWLVNHITISSIRTSFAGYDALLFIVIILLHVIHYALGAINGYIIAATHKRITFREYFYVYHYISSISLFTINLSGEIAQPIFLKKYGYTFSQGLSVSGIDRLISFLLALILSLIGAYLYLPSVPTAAICVIIAMIVSVLLMFYVSRTRRIIGNFIAKKLNFALEFFQSMRKILLLHPMRLAVNIMLSLTRVLIGSIKTLFAIWYLGGVFSWVEGFFLNVISRLISSIPLSINGIGILELSMVELFESVGVEPEITFTGLFANRIVTYGFGLMVVGWIYYGRDIIATKKNSGQ